jgi:murein DD-endopeptidase MepM/ murein hydrolase activator NlpD
MGAPGPARSPIAHAHPLTPAARASRAAVAFRAAERYSRSPALRSRRIPTPRLRVPVPAALALGAALLIAGQPLSPVAAPAGPGGDRSGTAMDLSLKYRAGSAQAVTTFPRSLTAPALGGRAVAADGSVAELSGYRWPLEHARITLRFGPSDGGLFIVGGQEFHDGIDLANFCGAPVFAAHDGVVIAAGRGGVTSVGWLDGLDAYRAYLNAQNACSTRARTVVIDDGNGYRSVYLQFHRISVEVGQVVHAGDVIGSEGSSGHATGCHLHYSLFSSSSTVVFRTSAKDVKRYHLPSAEIGRIDPLLVFPPLKAGWITWGWRAKATD